MAFLAENPSNKKYCFDYYHFSLRNYNEEIIESLNIILLSTIGEKLDLKLKIKMKIQEKI